MAQKVSSFKVGLFVLVGALLAVGSMIWLGTSRYLDTGKTYVCFFQKSVQGLQPDSTVKYKGVAVGRIAAIRVAPDFRLIEVVMNVQLEGDVSGSVIAQLKSVGITGLAFIELSDIQPGEENLSPTITFAAEHPIIPSKPSEITQIFSTIEKVAREFAAIDFQAMAAKLDAVFTAARNRLEDKRLDNILINTAAATKELAISALHMRKLVSRPENREVVLEVKKTLAKTQDLVEELKRAAVKMDLPRRSQEAGELLTGLDLRSGEVLEQIRLTSENLLRASEALERLVIRVERTPSDIIFSKPPKPREE